MAFLILFMILAVVSGDVYDDIRNQMASVDASNCHEKYGDEIRLPVTHLTTIQERIKEARNLALTRAFAFSITNQKLNASYQFPKQPGLFYYYLSSAAVVTSADPGIVGAGIYYDNHTAYPNWYNSLDFNQTISYYAPYASRDLSLPNTFKVKDDMEHNYVNSDFYRLWLPDSNGYRDKRAYPVLDRDGYYYSSVFGVGRDSPVLLTQPYFDCGRTNSWIVTAAAPVVDYLARYTFYNFIRRPRFVAVSTVDLDYSSIAAIPCGVSAENSLPNVFRGTHKCKPTTKCRAVPGHGFSRYGYECVCKPGFVYPAANPGPYSGRVVEEASDADYAQGFDCVQREPGGSQPEGSTPDISSLLQRIHSASLSDCSSSSSPVILPENSRIPSRLDAQITSTMRLVHFLSSYLQIDFGPLSDRCSDIVGDRTLNQDEIFAEVAGTVFADDQIASEEVVIDDTGVEKIASLSVKRAEDHDAASLTVSDADLVVNIGTWDDDMFRSAKERFGAGGFETRQLILDPWIRVWSKAANLTQVDPWTYKAPTYADGIWDAPEYSCQYGQWVVNFTMPILGKNAAGNDVEFRGQITVQILVSPSLLSDAYSDI